VGDAIRLMLGTEKLSFQFNSRRIYSAWAAASGADAYTLKRYYRDGKLYITVDSSVVRNQLSCQKQILIDKINAILTEDPLFIRKESDTVFVKELILK